MYVAKQHEIAPHKALEIATSIGAGQLITIGSGGPNATFVPFNVVGELGPIAAPTVSPAASTNPVGPATPTGPADSAGGVVVQAHLNRVNPQWRDEGEALLVVHGPNARISGLDFPPEQPTQKLPTVPTWNYVTVHLRGTLTFHDDADWKLRHLERLVDQHEEEWRMGTHSRMELIEAAFAAMVGVEIKVRDVVGKAKLGQNMSSANIAYTADRLRARDGSAAQVADLMEDIAIPWALSREERMERAVNGMLPIAWEHDTF